MMSAKQIIKNSSNHNPQGLKTKSIYFTIALVEFCLIWILITTFIVDFQYANSSTDVKNHHRHHEMINLEPSRFNFNVQSQNLLEQCINSSQICTQNLMTCIQSQTLASADKDPGESYESIPLKNTSMAT